MRDQMIEGFAPTFFKAHFRMLPADVRAIDDAKIKMACWRGV